MSEKLQCGWSPDCQGKLDYDADLVRLSCRYWPRGGGFLVTVGGRLMPNDQDVSPCASATIYLQDRELIRADFAGQTEAEVKAKVEAWAQAQFERIAYVLSETFSLTPAKHRSTPEPDPGK